MLAPTRWKLRRAVRAVNKVLGALGLEKHPDKTFIGRIERGFDFLGYHFGPEGLSVAKKTIEQFIKRASRLYEQKHIGKVTPDALGMYIQRWMRWVRSGVGEASYGWKTAARRPPYHAETPKRVRRPVCAAS